MMTFHQNNSAHHQITTPRVEFARLFTGCCQGVWWTVLIIPCTPNQTKKTGNPANTGLQVSFGAEKRASKNELMGPFLVHLPKKKAVRGGRPRSDLDLGRHSQKQRANYHLASPITIMHLNLLSNRHYHNDYFFFPWGVWGVGTQHTRNDFQFRARASHQNQANSSSVE